MKKIICITTILLFFTNLYSQNIVNQNDTIHCNCYVDRIRTFESYVVIDAHNQNDWYYSIISLKHSSPIVPENSVKIRPKRKYDFIFYPYSERLYIGDPRMMEIKIGTKRIIYKEDFKSGELVISTNLDGKYILY